MQAILNVFIVQKTKEVERIYRGFGVGKASPFDLNQCALCKQLGHWKN